MGTLSVFNHISLDGYFADKDGDMSWAHRSDTHPDPEWQAFVQGNARGGGVLLFGRRTYELMAQYWPTPLAAQANPVVAERMNALRKVVFSRTLEAVQWANTTLVKGDLIEETRKLKESTTGHIAILGSGSLVAALTQAGLIDDYQFAIVPVVLGAGKTMFAGIDAMRTLKLTTSRAFGNGNVLTSYTSAGSAA